MAYAAHSIEELRQIADSFNCELYVGGETRLLLDLDTPEALKQFNEARSTFIEIYHPLSFEQWESRNGGTHVVIDLGYALPVPHRLALQSSLGSDSKRTMIALSEWDDTHQDTISLFKPREAK